MMGMMGPLPREESDLTTAPRTGVPDQALCTS